MKGMLFPNLKLWKEPKHFSSVAISLSAYRTDPEVWVMKPENRSPAKCTDEIVSIHRFRCGKRLSCSGQTWRGGICLAGYLQNSGTRRGRDSEGAYDSLQMSRRGTKRRLKPPRTYPRYSTRLSLSLTITALPGSTIVTSRVLSSSH